MYNVFTKYNIVLSFVHVSKRKLIFSSLGRYQLSAVDKINKKLWGSKVIVF